MAATTKDELLAVAKKEFDKLDKLLAQVDEETALVKDEDDTSIKDVVGHRAHWISLFFGWSHDGLDGKEVFFPAEGYKWNDLKRYNAAIRAEQADLDWETACGDLRHAHNELIEFKPNRLRRSEARRRGPQQRQLTQRHEIEVITAVGPVEIDVPRDRDGSFDPATIRKNQRRLDGVDLDGDITHREGADDR